MNKLKSISLICASIVFLCISAPTNLFSQEQKDSQFLDQNISIFAEDEPLSDIIEKICGYLNIDYSYNSKLVDGKAISLNVSNKPIKFVLDQLMKDFYLIFEIEDNILVVRDYVPLDESLGYVNETKQFSTANRGFFFENPRKKSHTIKFETASNLIIIPVTINESDTLNFILDTGVRYPIITELPFINKLNLNYMMPVQVKGLGEGERGLLPIGQAITKCKFRAWLPTTRKFK